MVDLLVATSILVSDLNAHIDELKSMLRWAARLISVGINALYERELTAC